MNSHTELVEAVVCSPGHKALDVLKIDIEGSEWEVLMDIARMKQRSLMPKQILVEVHTQGANPTAVPAYDDAQVRLDPSTGLFQGVWLHIFMMSWQIVLARI